MRLGHQVLAGAMSLTTWFVLRRPQRLRAYFCEPQAGFSLILKLMFTQSFTILKTDTFVNYSSIKNEKVQSIASCDISSIEDEAAPGPQPAGIIRQTTK